MIFYDQDRDSILHPGTVYKFWLKSWLIYFSNLKKFLGFTFTRLDFDFFLGQDIFNI